MKLDNYFAREYTLVEPPELDQAYPLMEIPDGGAAERRVVVGVARHGHLDVVLRLKAGEDSSLDSACVLPDGGFMIVAGGEAYQGIFGAWELESVMPGQVVALTIFRDEALVILVGARDLLICTDRKTALVRDVAWDGIRVDGVVGRSLIGHGWSSPEQSWVAFQIDLETFDKQGGPEL